MKTFIVELHSITPYSQSRMHDTDKLEKELMGDYETRTWKEKAHWRDDGHAFIPRMAFTFALMAAAKHLSLQIPGKGKATFTKHFQRGVIILDEIALDESRDTVTGEWINANADGVRGSGKRVRRCFPVFPQWRGTLKICVLDDIITEDVFRQTLTAAGSMIGIGRFRPENGGYYGRFAVDSVRLETP